MQFTKKIFRNMANLCLPNIFSENKFDPSKLRILRMIACCLVDCITFVRNAVYCLITKNTFEISEVRRVVEQDQHQDLKMQNRLRAHFARLQLS